MNIFRDDVDHELSVLISQRPKEERAPGQDGPIFKSADNDFARSLGCQDCKSQSIKHGLSQDHVMYDTVNINMPADDKAPFARTTLVTPANRTR